MTLYNLFLSDSPLRPKRSRKAQKRSFYCNKHIFKSLPMSLTNASPSEAARAAKSASHILATLPTSARNSALTAIHDALASAKEDILAANARDLKLAAEAAKNGDLSLSIVARLDLGKKGKWEDMLKGILDVRDLEDPGIGTSIVHGE